MSSALIPDKYLKELFQPTLAGDGISNDPGLHSLQLPAGPAQPEGHPSTSV